MYVYCLFCRTQRCKAIAQLMEIRGVNRAFSPQILRTQRKEGKNERKSFDLLPGYVFIFNEERMTDYRFFYEMDGVIRRVGKQENGYELVGQDLEFAEQLLEKDGVVGAMHACRNGDEVVLEDPLFRGCQGKITKIDYRKERARVDFVFEKNPCHAWVSLEDVRSLAKPEGGLE